MRTPLIAALALLVLPLAAAQEPERPVNESDSRDAWVKDCPPDMMCAYGAGGDENATYEGDCGGEVCASDHGEPDRPNPYGSEDCIECSGPVGDGATCMDGQQEGESCRGDASCDASSSSADACGDDVQYLDGRGPPDCENCRGEDADPATQSGDAEARSAVPLPAVLVVVAALAAAVLIVRRA